MSLSETPRRSRLHAVLLLVATLCCGLFAGAAADRLLLFHQHRLLPAHGLKFISRHILERLDEDLHLNAQQKSAIGKILETREAAIEKIWGDIQPRVRSEIIQGDHEIEATLTPEQKLKFKQLRQSWHAHARAILGAP